MTESNAMWCSMSSYDSKAECQSGSPGSSAHPHDMDPQGIEIDVEFGSAYWNQALKQLQWTCLNCDRSPLDYDSGVQMLRRAAKLDQRIKEATVAVQDFGPLDMKLYKAWTGQTVGKKGAMPPPPPSQHDVHTWPMDDVLIYDHPKWQLFVGSLGCPDPH